MMSSGISIRRRGRSALLGATAAVWLALGGAVGAFAQAPALKPNYWQQRLFFIPYQVNRQDPAFKAVAKVQLLVSRDGHTDWRVLQEAEPNVQGFSYHAPEDGEYWFALRHLDQRGQPWPDAAVQPQMRIVVDTLPPQLELTGDVDATGAVVVRYEARDASLRPESLVIEGRSAGGTWAAIPLGPPDVTHADRLLGRVSWNPPAAASAVEFRGTVLDSAGRSAEAQTEVTIAGPAFDRSAAPPLHELPDDMAADPFRSRQSASTQNWPADNRLPSEAGQQSGRRGVLVDSAHQPPPEANSYTSPESKESAGRTPARLIGESPADLHSSRQASRPFTASVNAAPNASSTSHPSDDSVRMVNATTFDVEYDLESVGPWGVAKVELWGTHDGGRTWQSFGVDADNRSPFRVRVPGAGVYGFRILVDGANGAGSAPPRSGDQPELVIAIELQPPRVDRLTAELGEGNLAGHLVVRWSASDSNLEARPVHLSYASSPTGPWSTIAAGLENTGSYIWRLERHVPDRFYVKLEARDVAGNVGTSQTPAPITLDRPQPTGRLRGIRPVSGGSQPSGTFDQSL